MTSYTSIIDIHIVAGAPSLLGILLSANDRAKAGIRVRVWSDNVELLTASYPKRPLSSESRIIHLNNTIFHFGLWCLYLPYWPTGPLDT